MRNERLIDKTIEITVAKLSGTNSPTNEASGKAVADFMQEIYNKLSELSEADD